jgi:PPM family protein phosphatase
MNFRVGARTDIGRVRERNDDSMLIKDPLFAVADGMGGHRGGDVASAMTLEALERFDTSQEGVLGRLVEEIQSANRAVLERGTAEASLQGMGTTLTALVADDGTAYLAHVGDSRAYLLRDGSLQRLTEDHTLVQRMVREGRITPQQAENHPQRNILTKALGVEQDLSPDPLTMDIHPGDRILLCTDGLSGMLDEDRIREVLDGEPDPQRAADQLVAEAIEAGGDDNVTVVVIDVLDGERPQGHVSTKAVAPGGPDGGGHAASASPGLGTAVRTEPRIAGTGVWTAPPTAEGEGPEEEPAAGSSRRSVRRRVVAWIAILAVALGAAFFGFRIYLSHQWYVGESNGRVAIFQGIPATVLGYRLSHVEQGTDVDATQAEQLDPWRDLEDGITTGSLEEARGIVTQIRQDLTQTSERTP